MPALSSEPAVPLVLVDPQEDEISPHDVDPVTGPSDALVLSLGNGARCR